MTGAITDELPSSQASQFVSKGASNNAITIGQIYQTFNFGQFEYFKKDGETKRGSIIFPKAVNGDLYSQICCGLLGGMGLSKDFAKLCELFCRDAHLFFDICVAVRRTDFGHAMIKQLLLKMRPIR
nr:hypothetical protein [uncultured Cohaesibacter sp.]